jgi:hypothetical protein
VVERGGRRRKKEREREGREGEVGCYRSIVSLIHDQEEY